MKIGLRLIAGAAALMIKGSAVAHAQLKASEPIKTTVCDLVKTPEVFNGKVVVVKAAVVTGFESSFISDATCRVWLTDLSDHSGSTDNDGNPIAEYAYFDSTSDLEHPTRLKWTPVRRQSTASNQDKTRGKLYDLISQYYVPAADLTPGFPQSCPKYRVTATLVGWFDHYDAKRQRAVRTTSSGKISVMSVGFGHLGQADSQFALKSVSDLIATPIDRSVYLKKQ